MHDAWQTTHFFSAIIRILAVLLTSLSIRILASSILERMVHECQSFGIVHPDIQIRDDLENYSSTNGDGTTSGGDSSDNRCRDSKQMEREWAQPANCSGGQLAAVVDHLPSSRVMRASLCKYQSCMV